MSAISPEEFDQVFESIIAWRKSSDLAFQSLEEMVNVRLIDTEIQNYLSAVFFTIGLPYSLVLKNVIPLCHVNIHARPDIFVVNNILYEHLNNFGSAIVFSPAVFEKEETEGLINHLKAQGYFVKALLQEDALAYNLHINLKEFPFDLLHICSHGGEVKGTRLSLQFQGEDDKAHTVEYESVVSLSASPTPNKLMVQEKWFPKLLDGMEWGSNELKEQVPRNIRRQVHQKIMDAEAKDKKVLEKDIVVTNSTHIKCYDGNYQAMIQLLASHTSPLIFNNTCWSWYHIAQNFLHGGARGYIGTLWNVRNSDAVQFATAIYDGVLKRTILGAFHTACKNIEGTKSENVYIYWGLPFTRLRPLDLKEARHRIMEQLTTMFYKYEKNATETPHGEVKRSIKEITDWITHELEHEFKDEFMKERNKRKAMWEEKYKNNGM